MNVVLEGVELRPFDSADLDWVLAAMVDGQRATLSSQRAATTTEERLLADARADFDRYHSRAHGADEVILAWYRGERIGLLWITLQALHQGEGNAWLLAVFVDRRYRRKGLGGRLMRWAEDWAAGKGAKEIWLNVGGGNDQALALYRSRGFEVETMHLGKRL